VAGGLEFPAHLRTVVDAVGDRRQGNAQAPKLVLVTLELPPDRVSGFPEGVRILVPTPEELRRGLKQKREG
jgi:hypothetical protein